MAGSETPAATEGATGRRKPVGHGRCLTHENYDLDCADFERLRARAGDRCEMPGCGITGPETPHGILFIDHTGPLGRHARVRGMLCSPHNSALGYAEARPGSRRRRDPAAAEAAYLARPFWREPESVAAQARKDALLKRRRELIVELDKRSRGERSAFDGLPLTAAIAQVIQAGARQADICRGTRFSQPTVSRYVKLWRG